MGRLEPSLGILNNQDLRRIASEHHSAPGIEGRVLLAGLLAENWVEGIERLRNLRPQKREDLIFVGNRYDRQSNTAIDRLVDDPGHTGKKRQRINPLQIQLLLQRKQLRHNPVNVGLGERGPGRKRQPHPPGITGDLQQLFELLPAPADIEPHLRERLVTGHQMPVPLRLGQGSIHVKDNRLEFPHFSYYYSVKLMSSTYCATRVRQCSIYVAFMNAEDTPLNHPRQL